MNPEIPLEELAHVLDDVAMDILSRAGVDRPPVNMLGVARALGMSLAWDRRQPGRARLVRTSGCFTSRSQASILLRPEPRQERRQWAVAHEVGEQHAVHVFLKLGIDPPAAPAGARETIANLLAGRLLLPGGWFRSEALEVEWDLFGLKATFSTASHEMIARRMLDFDRLTIITIFDQDRITFRRGNFSAGLPPLSEAESDCQRRSHIGGEPSRATEDGRIIDGWPVHEENWQREIVRVSIPEEFG